MSDFTEKLTKAQQFMLLQAYADKILTETELLSFLLLEDREGTPVMITQSNTYIIHADIDFDKITATVSANHEWELASCLPVAASFEVKLQKAETALDFIFDNEADAQAFAEDLKTIYKVAASYGN